MEQLRAAGGHRVVFFDLEAPSGWSIYLHAKVCVIDDVWMIGSSDNLNLRSWTNDSELSCAVVDERPDDRPPADPAGLAAIGMFISTLTETPVGAMPATLGLFILSGVLDAVPQVSAIHPWLLTHNWLSFSDVVHTNIVWDGIVRNLGLQALYVVVFGTAARARFTTKDILA